MIIDKISEEFPVLTEAEKERIFAMSEKKYNMDNQEKNNVVFDENTEDTEVRGVEQYNRPILSRLTSIAAAAAILTAGVSGGTAFMKYRKSNSTANTNIETTEAVTERVTNKEDELLSEYENIAYQFTNKFAEIENKYYYHALSVDKDDTLTFNVYTSDMPWRKAEEKKFYRVTDADFQSGEDLKNALKGLFTDELYNRLLQVNSFSNSNYETLIINPDNIYLYLCSDFDVDLSKYENNSEIDIVDVNYHSMDFITYNGGFYVSNFYNKMPEGSSYSSYPHITQKDDDSFSATIFANFAPFVKSDNSRVGTKLKFDFVCENGEWKISDIDVGRNMESAAAYAVKDYFINVCEDYKVDDLMITKNLFTNDLEEDIIILSNDDDISCKTYCIIKDKNEKAYLEFKGNVIFSCDGFTYDKSIHDRSGFKLTNVSIKQLN
ncbi:MAG: hypothetical protein K5898_07910 [Ruminococcus sp.]|uniref:hypothetical protein n=1 Tax=Ruminococcus sp. TaxID=41978 RepID=UPI0025D1C757|nr:hypothetical protein [Ruminococcus sp.]MCR4795075.1 hypothetical protein [Ruminococcus sp.]